MNWRSLLGRLFGSDQTRAFGEEVAALAREHQPQARLLLEAERLGTAPLEKSAAWWQGAQQELLGKYPDADRLALSAFLDRAPTEESTGLLRLWVLHRPAPEALEAVFARLEALMEAAAQGEYTASQRVAIYSASGVAYRLESPPHNRYRALVLRAVQHFQAINPASRDLHSDWQNTCSKLLERMLPELGANPADTPLVDALLDSFPILAHTWYRGAKAMSNREAVVASMNRLIDRALRGDPDPAVYKGLVWYKDYAGMDHFLAGCRALEKHAGVKPPTERYLGYGNPIESPLTWAATLLRRIKPPAPRDEERAAELAAIDPAALITASLYAPSWAPLAEPVLDWPGFGAIARWLKRYGGLPFDYGSQGEEEEEGGGADRQAAVEALEQMGEKRYKQLTKHPVAKGLYRDGLFYLEAVRGQNAADVEAKFLKRNKQAVRALGLLPDEGDILQRYLALRRFAKEAKQFGSQRQASERLAAEAGLANLAETAGFADLAQLEWAMEAQVAAEVDPSTRRWQIEEYEVWIKPDEKATLVVERDGKTLKSVPPAVRQAPEYEEIKEAREMLTTQWDRVLRRLEAAMALGEVMSPETFMQGFATPAGRAMIPGLVLICSVDGRPVELLASGPQDLERAETVQVAHPLQLANNGTLHAWQERVAALGLTQPFPQLLREVYRRPAGEKAHDSRFAGRKVRVGTCVEQLKRRGWQMNGEHGIMKRLPGRLYANFWFTDGAAYNPAMDILTCDDVWLERKASALIYSEVMRDVDLATAAAAINRTLTANERSE